MRLSPKGLALLSQWEGLRLRVYSDSAGYPTIGVGHLLTPPEKAQGSLMISGAVVPYANGITREQAMALLAQDVIPRENVVTNSVRVLLPQNQFDALVSFTFNVGAGNFLRSGLLHVLNAGRPDLVPGELRRWTRAGGMLNAGLVRRRENEIALWEGRL